MTCSPIKTLTGGRADFAVSDSGSDDSASLAKIARSKKVPFPRILVSVNMLDTGFNYPEIVNLVMAGSPGRPSCISRCAGAARAAHPTSRRLPSECSTLPGSPPSTEMTRISGDGGFVVTATKPDPTATRRGLLLLDVNDHIDPTTAVGSR